jgi:hypothetical protein
MPVENILFLGLVISAFATFAALLTYAERVTRRVADKTPRRARIKREASHHREEPASVRKAA